MVKQTATETQDTDQDIDFEELDADFTETEEAAGFGVLPQGYYLAQLAAVEIRTGPKGKYLNFEFQIIEPEEHAGHKVWDIASFAEKSKPYTLKTLGVIAGHPIPRAPFRLADWEDELVGKVVKLKVAPQEREGSGEQDDVKAILPVGNGLGGGGFESAASRTKRGKASSAVFE